MAGCERLFSPPFCGQANIDVALNTPRGCQPCIVEAFADNRKHVEVAILDTRDCDEASKCEKLMCKMLDQIVLWWSCSDEEKACNTYCKSLKLILVNLTLAEPCSAINHNLSQS